MSSLCSVAFVLNKCAVCVVYYMSVCMQTVGS